MVLLEAEVCSLPVVATKVGGNGEEILNGAAAAQCSQRDSEALGSDGQNDGPPRI